MTDSGTGPSTGHGGGQSRLQIPGYAPVRGMGVDRAGALVEARQLSSGNRVAIRVLSPALASDKRFVRRLRRDTGRLTALRHPNLVGVIGFDPDARALITEYAGGVTLRRLIDGTGPMTPEAASVLLGGMLAALGTLHSAGVLHRDLRPDVVYIDAAGAVRVRDAGIPAPPLHAGWTAGTPRYLAPELWQGHDHAIASDLYAAAAVFVEALTGHPPFSAPDLAGLMRQHENAPVPDDALPPSARSLVLAGLAKNPADRPKTAADFQRRLQADGASFFEDGWAQNGETWLSEAAAARLMDPPAAERAPLVIPDDELAGPPPPPEPRAPSRLRRRLALAGAVASAAFVALCVVVVGAALLGHGGSTPAAANPTDMAGTPTPATFSQESAPSPSPSDSISPSASESAAPSATVPTGVPTEQPTTAFSSLPTPTPTPTPHPHTPTPTPATPTPTHTPCILTPPLC